MSQIDVDQKALENNANLGTPARRECRHGDATAHCPGLSGRAPSGLLAALRTRDEPCAAQSLTGLRCGREPRPKLPISRRSNGQAAAEGGFTTSIDTSSTTLGASMSLDANLVLTAALGSVPAGALLQPYVPRL